MGAHRKKLQGHNSRTIARLTGEYHRACRKLFSKADLKRAAAVAQQVKREWREASLKANGDGKALAALKDAARRKFRRLVAEALPQYRQWQVLHRIFQQEHRKLVGLSSTGLHGNLLDVGWGDLTVTPPPPGAVEWVPPFPLFDMQLLDPGDHVTSDASFTGPGAGNLVNNIVFNHDEDTPAIIGVFGLIRPESATSIVSCGHAFRLPQAGRLQVNANIRNYYNKAVLSLQDRFGFSYGKLRLRANLFIDIVRGSEVLHLPTSMIDTRLDSGGDDASQTVTDIDNSMLYQIVGTTDDILPLGEQVQILVGAEISIDSELDDMESHVAAVYYWQVRRIFAGVV